MTSWCQVEVHSRATEYSHIHILHLTCNDALCSVHFIRQNIPVSLLQCNDTMMRPGTQYWPRHNDEARDPVLATAQWWGPGPSIGHSTVVFSYLCRGINRRDCQNCSVLYCVLTLCTVISTLRWAVLTVLWIGFWHNGHGMLFRCLSELPNCTLRSVTDKNSAVSRIFQRWPNMIVPVVTVAVTADMWYVTLLFVQCQTGPVWQNPIQRTVRTAHLSVLMTVSK